MADPADTVIKRPKLTDGNAAENDITGDGGTALHAAVLAGEETRVKELLSTGADVNALDSDGETSLHIAARQGLAVVVRALLSTGADTTLRHGPYQLSALHWSTRVGCWGALDVLIAHGVDLNAECCCGLKPLHVSVMGDNIVAIDRLVGAGADIEARDERGFTPLHLAVNRGKSTVLWLMLQRWGADMDALDNFGRSPLHLAAAADNSSLAVRMVQGLLDAGASIGHRDEDGRSALDHAAEAGNAGVLSAMIEHDVDVTAIASTPAGFTAIHYAAAAECDNPKAIDVLVEAGADIAATDKDGDNCLHYAASYCNINVVRAILRLAGGEDGLERMDLQEALWSAATSAGKQEKPAAPVVDLLLRWGAHESVFAGAYWRLRWKGPPRDAARQQDVKRVRALLTNAPKDRSWRRRGFFVVCRAFPDRAQLKPEEEEEEESRLSQCGTPTRSCSRPRLPATDGGGASEWVGVVGRLLWLDDGVFRAIMEYV